MAKKGTSKGKSKGSLGHPGKGIKVPHSGISKNVSHLRKA